jgi:hypothetical protein
MGRTLQRNPCLVRLPTPVLGLGLYDNGRQTFLSVPIVNVDEDPAKNIKPLPVHGPSMAMLPGPSVLRSLIPIEEEVDIMNDPRFIPLSLCGGEAGPDVEVKEGGGGGDREGCQDSGVLG